jgi:hypothetical protein
MLDVGEAAMGDPGDLPATVVPMGDPGGGLPAPLAGGGAATAMALKVNAAAEEPLVAVRRSLCDPPRVAAMAVGFSGKERRSLDLGLPEGEGARTLGRPWPWPPGGVKR